MDIESFWFSLVGENSSTVLEFRPECIMEEDLASLCNKFPLIPGSQGSITFCTTHLSEKLREIPSDADFDLTDPYSPPPPYNVLHDPHLKEYFQNPAMRHRLLEKGFITKNGFVKCTLREFNQFREWIRKLKLDRLHQESRKERTGQIEAWNEKLAHVQLLRDEELYSIVRMREERTRELQERAGKRREVERRKCLKLEEQYWKRREKVDKERRRKRDWREGQRDRNVAERCAKKFEDEKKVKKIKFRILAKNSEDDKTRQRMLEKRRQSLMEERTQKTKDQWKRRCSFSLLRLAEKHQQEEEERQQHMRNVAQRAAMVARQRRRCKVHHDQCLQKRRNTLVQEHLDADMFLANIRNKKLRDLERWKQKHVRMCEGDKDRRMSLGPRPSDRERKRRSRLSSIWDLESSLRKDFGIEDNVVYSGVVFPEKKAKRKTRKRVQLDAVAEEEGGAEQAKKERYDKLLSKLETELAVREKVHHTVFGIVSKAQNILDMEALGVAHEHAKQVQNYVQAVVDAAHETNVRAREIVANATEGAKELRIAAMLHMSAREVAEAAISSATQSLERIVVKDVRDYRGNARKMAATALDAAKASLERLYGRKIELMEDERQLTAKEISKTLAESAKVVAVAAIVSATRSLEMSIGEDDVDLIAARSLASDAVEAAKASVERLYGFRVEIDDESELSSSKTLAESAKDIAAAAILSATGPLERAIGDDDFDLIAARSLASSAVEAAKASLERLYGIKVEEEDKLELTSRELSKRLSQSAKDIVAAAMISATRSLEKVIRHDDVEVIAARSLATDAVEAAKASLERLYKTAVEHDLEDDNQQSSQEVSKTLAESANAIAEAAIVSATRSLERTLAEDDLDIITARSLAVDAVKEAKASLEGMYGIKVDSDDSHLSVQEISDSLAESAKDIAAAAIASATQSFERAHGRGDIDVKTARSLASGAVKAAKGSIERLYGIKVEPEDMSEQAAKGIAAAAVVSAARDLGKGDRSMLTAARGLATHAVDSAKASIERLYGIKVEPEESSKLRTHEMSTSLMESAKDIARAAITSAVRTLGGIYAGSSRHLVTTTRELVSDALDSTKASLKCLYDMKFEMLDSEGMWKSLDSTDEYAAAAVASVTRSLEGIRTEQDEDDDLMRTGQKLSDNALQSAKASMERLYCITFELEDKMKRTAVDISRALVDSSGSRTKQLENEGLAHASRDLACRAIVSAAKSFPTSQKDKRSLQDITSSDTSLLEAAAKVSQVSANASLGELFDRGFLGGTEMEEAAKYLATQALMSAHTQLERMEDEGRSLDLDLEVCKAASELVSHDRVATRFSLTNLREENERETFEHDINHGTMFWKVTAFVEGIINSTLKYLGSPRDLSDIPQSDILEYEIISYDEVSTDDQESGAVVVDDSYQEERLQLRASRIVNDVLENAIDIVKTSMTKDANVFLPERSSEPTAKEKPGASRRRRSSVHFDETEMVRSRRGSVTNRPPTPRFRKDRAGSVILQEVEELEKELAIPSVDDVISEDVSSSSLERRCSDPGSGAYGEASEAGLRRRSASSSTIDKLSIDEDGETFLAKKVSLYDSIMEREERASCDVSSCSSYVVLPRLEPSERSLIAKEVSWNQKKTTSSVTSLPSLSPKGSIVSCETAIEQAKVSGKEPQKASTSSSSRLPEITSITKLTSAPSSKSSVRVRSLTETSMGPKTASSKHLQKSPTVTPSASKERVKLSSRLSSDKAVLSPRTSEKNASVSSPASLQKGEDSLRSSVENVTISPRASLDKAKVSRPASTEKETSSSRASLTKTTLSPSSSTQRVALSKRASTQNVAGSPNASSQSCKLSARVPLEKTTSPSMGRVALSPRISVEKANLSLSASKGKIALSPRTSSQKTTLSPSVSGSTLRLPPSASTEKASLSPCLSREKAALSSTSSRSSLKKSTLTPRASNAKCSLSPTTSTGKAAVSPRISIHKASDSALSSTSASYAGQDLPVKSSDDTPTASPKSSTEFSPSNDPKKEPTFQVETESLPTTVNAGGTQLRERGSEKRGSSLKDAAIPVQMAASGKESVEPKEFEADQNLRKAVHSLDRFVQERRLTPEGAEAEPRPISNADNKASKKDAVSASPQNAISYHVESAGNDAPLLKKKALSLSMSDSGIGVKDSSRMSGDGPRVMKSQEEEIVKTVDGVKEGSSSRKKPEGKDQDEDEDAIRCAGIESPYQAKDECQKTLEDSLQTVGSSKEPQRISQPSSRASSSGGDTARKVSVSGSVNDAMEDILHRTLSITEATSTERDTTSASRRGSRGEMKRDSEVTSEVSRMRGRGHRDPTAKISRSVLDTVDYMVQSASSSDGRRGREGSGRRSRGSELGFGAPRMSSTERLPRGTTSSQEVLCMQDIYPTPPDRPKPKLPSPKRSRVKATFSRESLGLRATQSDSSLSSSSSDKAADLKPKVSGAWLDEDTTKGTSAKSSHPKRPLSSPTTSQHRRSSEISDHQRRSPTRSVKSLAAVGSHGSFGKPNDLSPSAMSKR